MLEACAGDCRRWPSAHGLHTNHDRVDSVLEGRAAGLSWLVRFTVAIYYHLVRECAVVVGALAQTSATSSDGLGICPFGWRVVASLCVRSSPPFSSGRVEYVC